MKNLTSVLVAVGVFIILIFVGLLIILDKDPSTYVGSLTTIITVVAGLGLIGNRLDKVSKNVNGNTTRLLEDNDRLRKLAGVREGVPVERPDSEYAPPLLSEDTLTSISDINDKLPTHRA